MITSSVLFDDDAAHRTDLCLANLPFLTCLVMQLVRFPACIVFFTRLILVPCRIVLDAESIRTSFAIESRTPSVDLAGFTARVQTPAKLFNRLQN
jgi:hypothetical protein